jgi:hypothetical protein
VRLAIQARPWPLPRQKRLASVGVSPPIFFFLSVLTVIRPKRRFANASTGICACCGLAWSTE